MDYFSDEDDDYEWDYVEDAYDEADNLAEHSCPSPPLVDSITHNIPYEDDPFDIWVDIEYLSDSYYDKPNTNNTDYQRRKRKLKANYEQARKKQKGEILEAERRDEIEPSPPLVLWRKTHDRGTLQEDSKAARSSKRKPVALLKDWKERFRNATGLAVLQPSETNLGQDGSFSEDAEISGEGFDLNSIESIAGVLPEEAINTLKDIIKAKGLDPEAVQIVLKDLLEGREPDLGDSEDEEVAEDEMDEEGDEEMHDPGLPVPSPGAATTSLTTVGQGSSFPEQTNEHVATSSISNSGGRSDRKRKEHPSSDELHPPDPSSPLQQHTQKKHKQRMSDTADSLSAVDLNINGARMEDTDSMDSEKISPKTRKAKVLADANMQDTNDKDDTHPASDEPPYDPNAVKPTVIKSAKATTEPGSSKGSALGGTSNVVGKGKGKRKADVIDDNTQEDGLAVKGAGLRRSTRNAKKPRAK